MVSFCHISISLDGEPGDFVHRIVESDLNSAHNKDHLANGVQLLQREATTCLLPQPG